MLRACGDVQFACFVFVRVRGLVLTSGELVRVHLSSHICELISDITFISHLHLVNFCMV